MCIYLGLDVGTSTTKIAAVNDRKEVLMTRRIQASDQLTSVFGAIGGLLYELELKAEAVDGLVMTGMGSTFVKGRPFDLVTDRVLEFEALGRGGLFLGGLDRAVIASLGTGSTLIWSDEKGSRHVGGSAVGGGTLVGLSSRLFGVSDAVRISEMAEKGNLRNVDWNMVDITLEDVPTLPDYATASNLGRMKPEATDADVALGLLNMIYQTAGTMAVYACRIEGCQDVVVTGSLASLKLASLLIGRVGELYHVNFIIPKQAAFATAIGAALIGLDRFKKA